MSHRKSDALIEMDREAQRLYSQGDYRRAVETFLKILAMQPDYEHGAYHYCLAICQEEIGDFAEAEKSFVKALEYMPDDTVRLGGYASFLYLYGDHQKAFNVHLRLLGLEQAQGNTLGADRALQALRTLGKNLRLSAEEFERQTGEKL